MEKNLPSLWGRTRWDSHCWRTCETGKPTCTSFPPRGTRMALSRKSVRSGENWPRVCRLPGASPRKARRDWRRRSELFARSACPPSSPGSHFPNRARSALLCRKTWNAGCRLWSSSMSSLPWLAWSPFRSSCSFGHRGMALLSEFESSEGERFLQH